jgi:hypothetical protein
VADHHLPPVNVSEVFRTQSRDAANEIIVTLRTQLNVLHKAMLATADNPNPGTQFSAWAASMELAGTANATARAMKDVWEAMKEKPE